MKIQELILKNIVNLQEVQVFQVQGAEVGLGEEVGVEVQVIRDIYIEGREVVILKDIVSLPEARDIQEVQIVQVQAVQV